MAERQSEEKAHKKETSNDGEELFNEPHDTLEGAGA
jgi:hypothetical protein